MRPDTVALWHKITTVEGPEWTRRYHATDPAEKAFGGHVAVTLDDGRVIADEIAVADAHPAGARPWRRSDYVAKFHSLANDIVQEAERARFIATVERLPNLSSEELGGLTFVVSPDHLVVPATAGIFSPQS